MQVVLTSKHFSFYRASAAEWLEHEVAVREVSDSSPGRGGRREPSDYVNFCMAVKKQWFHTLKHT